MTSKFSKLPTYVNIMVGALISSLPTRNYVSEYLVFVHYIYVLMSNGSTTYT